jgi:hypothetical protein
MQRVAAARTNASSEPSSGSNAEALRNRHVKISTAASSAEAAQSVQFLAIAHTSGP